MTVLSRRAVLGAAVGAAVGGRLFAQQPADPVKAADPLGAMLAEARAAYARVRDYSCTFTRQERINATLLPEQVAEMKVRVQPYSVRLRVARPEGAAGLELCYAANRHAGKVRYRPAGAKGGNGFLTLSAEDPKLLAANRHAPGDYGVGRVIELLTAVAARERALNNPVEAFTSDFQFAGRAVTRYDVYTRRPHAHRHAYAYHVYVDHELKLPVRLEVLDQPKAGAAAGDLLEAYSYSDVKLNVGLGNSAFDA